MTRKRAVKTVIALAVSLAALGVLAVKAGPPVSLPFTSAPPPGFYKVLNVADGDTFTVEMGGQEERVRMIGVDTPETHKPGEPVQCFGPQASDFTKQLLNDANVRLEADPTGDNRDRYGRLLRYAYLPDGRLVNELLISEGYGFAYLTFTFQKKAYFASSHQTAQSAKAGLWTTCSPQLKDGRWQSNSAN